MIDYILTHAKGQIIAGTTLATTPVWVHFFQNVSLVATSIAAVCGAIIAVHGVWKIIKNSAEKN